MRSDKVKVISTNEIIFFTKSIYWKTRLVRMIFAFHSWISTSTWISTSISLTASARAGTLGRTLASLSRSPCWNLPQNTPSWMPPPQRRTSSSCSGCQWAWSFPHGWRTPWCQWLTGCCVSLVYHQHVAILRDEFSRPI